MQNTQKQKKRRPHWEMADLVSIGIFAAVAKVSSFLIALAGGGMNPLTLMLKNLFFTTLVIVLLYKVRKFGTLTLFFLISSIVSLFLRGGFTLLPGTLLACAVVETVMLLLGGYEKDRNLLIGMFLFDLLFRVFSLGMSYLMVREEAAMLVVATVLIGIGYIGAFAGLFTGVLFVRELRHACIIRT